MKKRNKLINIYLLVVFICANFITSCTKENLDNQLDNQNNTEENLLAYSKQSIANQLKIKNELSKNNSVDFNNFTAKLNLCKNESELKLLFENIGINNSQSIILLLKKETDLQNTFRKENSQFYKLNENEKNKLFNTSIDLAFNEIISNTSIFNKQKLVSCESTLNTATSRCDRNFAICGAGAVLAAGFTGGLGGLIGGGVCMADFYFCNDDAKADFQSCKAQ